MVSTRHEALSPGLLQAGLMAVGPHGCWASWLLGFGVFLETEGCCQHHDSWCVAS